MTDEQIKELIKNFGQHKINLIYPDDEREGIWVTPASSEDRVIYDDVKSFSKKYKAHLLNQPLGWCRKHWGDEIIVTTNGDARPLALAEDNEAKIND